MTRGQQYIGSMLEGVAEGQLSSDEHRLTLAKIREKLASAEDFEGELVKLYRVTGFADFAMSLLWIADRVEHNPQKVEYSPDEQEMVVSHFRAAVGDEGPVVQPEPQIEPEEQPVEPEAEAPAETEAPTEEVFGEVPAETEPEQEQAQESTTEAPSPEEETPEMPQQPQTETSGAIDATDQSADAAPAGSASGTEAEFAALMEKFVESMQSGAEDRESLFESVMEACTAAAPETSGAPPEQREFSQLLIDFLTYIKENGFMDDVRVMNILSNVSGSVASWAEAAPDARAGTLDEGLEVLRSFKSLFE